MRAFEAVCSSLWAIREEVLEQILQISLRQHDADWEALSAKLGKPLEHTHKATHRDGIATIPVDGPLFQKANMMTRYSGATSYDTLAQDLRSALDDPSIRGVLLSVNSPGGQVHGTSEFASLVRSAKGVKPVWSHVWGDGASAGYWLASAAERVSVAPTGMLGSIGVVAALRNKKDPHEVQIVSSVSPNKRPDLDTPAGRSEVQREVDATARVFVDTVASHRGTTAEKVLADFGKGGCLVGQDAVVAGMADHVGTYEEAHAALEASARPRLSFLMPGVSVPAPSVTFGVPT
jgi:ClpP class serine protease